MEGCGAQPKGYERGEWASYQQWQDRGAQVRKGEKATTVVFWKFANSPVEAQEDGEEHTAGSSRLLLTRGYSAFNYPGMQVPAHIHFVLWGGGYPLQWTEELKFEGDRYLTPDALTEDARLGDFRNIQQLTREEDKMLHCSFKIRLQHESNFH